MSTAENDIDVLDSRVDQIVAPSGEAPSAAEVSDARVGADGVTYLSLGDAIRAMTAFDKTIELNFTTGKYIDFGDGSVGISSGGYWSATEDYSVIKGSQVLHTWLIGTSTVAAVAFYDANKEYISGQRQSSMNTYAIVNVPQNAVYARFSTTTTDLANSKVEIAQMHPIENLQARINIIEQHIDDITAVTNEAWEV